MKITFILDTFGSGGKEKRCLQLIQGLNQRGYDNIQIIILTNEIAYKELFACKCEIEIIDRKYQKMSIFNVLFEVNRLLKKFRPDVLQVWGLMSAFYTNILSPFYHYKYYASYVADVISPNFFSLNYFTNLICKRICNAIIGNSKAGFIAYGIPKKKQRLIYNGFNENRWNNAISNFEAKNRLNISTDYVVGMFASLGPYKDYQCFIDAAKISLKKNENITFLAVGGGSQLNHFNSLIDHTYRKKIRLLGFRDDVDKIMCACDISVLCSNLKIKEGLSNSIVESMAFGIPVLASDGGGTPELIEDGRNGILIKYQTPENVSKMILDLLENKKLRKRISLKATSTIHNQFLLKTMVDQYVELYQ